MSRVGAFLRELGLTWRALDAEQRVAGIASILLVISTFGPFSFIEAAVVLVALAVLLLLRMRAEERQFHLPFGDGTVIAAAGLWCGALIALRVFDRPLGQGLLALTCAALMVAAGIRERSKRPADDLPSVRAGRRPPPDWLEEEPPAAGGRGSPGGPPGSAPGSPPAGGARTVPLPGEERTLPLPEQQRTLPLPDESRIPTVGDPPELRLPQEKDGAGG